MAEISRGTLKGFDAGTYLATVQLEDSRAAYAANVPVSRGIPAVEMVAGRACYVVFQNPDDATDAMLVAISG